MSKQRLDVTLVERGLIASREKAKATIMAGSVSVNGQRVDKPGTQVTEKDVITVARDTCPYVGRGGLKLEKALDVFALDLTGAVCVDMGASTGGFTDCMLQRGADKVYAIDVGYGQLDWKLRTDPRVVNIERTNIRYMDPDLVEEPAKLVTIDVSFISLALILPVASRVAAGDGHILALVKPQFEAGREQVGKNGIVRDPAVHREVIRKVRDLAPSMGLTAVGLDYSPVTGAKGNIEYLMLLRPGRGGDTETEDAEGHTDEKSDRDNIPTLSDETIASVVEASHKELETK